MFGNAVQLFSREAMNFITYQPQADVLAASMVPIRLLRSVDGLAFAPMTNGWLETSLGIVGETISGHHAPYLDTADTFAAELRPLLRQAVGA
jgi:hypothetical protein